MACYKDSLYFLPIQISVDYGIHDNNHYALFGSHETHNTRHYHGDKTYVLGAGTKRVHVTAHGKFVTRPTVHRTVRLWIRISLHWQYTGRDLGLIKVGEEVWTNKA
jgi:hypothetical protein